MSKYAFNQAMEESNLSHINTQIIHPIAINQDTATFNITNRGGSLDKHTALVLPITCAQPVDKSRQSFLPINVGIGAVIRSAQLVSNGNGVVICQNDNVGQWFALAHSFQQQEFRKRVLKCRHGIFEDYEASDAGVMNLAGATANAPGRLGVGNLNNLNRIPADASSSDPNYPATALGEIDSFENALNTNYRIKPTSATTANLYVRLEALFPKMYNGLQLPIHMIEAGVSLVIQFSRNGATQITNERGCMTSNNNLAIVANAAGASATTPLNISILTNEVVLLTDYLVAKDDDQLAARVMSPEGLTLQFGDLLWNSFFLKGYANAGQVAAERNYKRDTFNLGAANEVIRQMYLFFNPTQTVEYEAKGDTINAAAPAGVARQRAWALYNAAPTAGGAPGVMVNPLKNIYASIPLSNLKDGERLQIKINQQNVFNQPLESNAHKLHELQTAYGSSFCKPQCTYENTDIVFDSLDSERFAGTFAGDHFGPKSLMAYTASIQGWTCQNLVGSNHFIGVNLQKPLLTNQGNLIRANLPGSGTRCGPTPIVIEIDRLIPRQQRNSDRNINVCLVVEKTLNIRMGSISVIDN